MSTPSTINLTPEELFDLTGYRRPTKQAAWLKANRFKFHLNAQLQPKVNRRHYESKVGVIDAQHTRGEISGPDWSAMGA